MPVESVDASRIGGLYTEDVLEAVACWEDGVAEPAAVTRELVERSAGLNVDIRERTDARELGHDVLVIAAGASSPSSGRAFRSGRFAGIVEVGPVASLPQDPPMVLEAETGFHFRRRDEMLGWPWAKPRRAGRTARRSTTGSSRNGAPGSHIDSRPRPALRSSARGRASTT